MLSGTKTDNEKFRLDDEFFQKGYLKAYLDIKSKPSSKVGEVIDILTDYHANGSYENLNNHVKILDQKDYAYMIRSTDLEKRDFQNDVKYVSRSAYEFLSKTKLYGGEILINKIGSPGRVYLMPSLDKPATLGMNLFMIRLKKDSNFNEKFVWAFFHSSLGQKIIYRKVNGTVPLTIDKEAVKSLYLPKLSKKFQDFIGTSVEKSECCLKESKITYNKAESLLLKSLGLENFFPSNKNTNIKSFKDSFATTGRLDAEYYQPKYEEVIAHIKSQPHAKLSDLVAIKKSIEPGSDEYSENDEGLPFLRVADYNKFGITEPQKKLKTSFVVENQSKLDSLRPKAETILFSKDGSVGEAYCLDKDSNFITSGAILHLCVFDKKKVLPDYLTLALNSKLVRMQAERDAGGSIILHWRVGEIEEVLIPLIDPKTQSQISLLIQESFALKSKSEKLLELAKKAVEMAIEESEEEAMKFINQQFYSN